MKFRTVTGSPFESDCDLVVVSVCGDLKKDASFKAANAAMDGTLTELAADERFAGKEGQTLVAPTYGDLPASRVALLGAGPSSDLTASIVRDLAARAVKLGRAKGAKSVCFVPPAGKTSQLRLIAEGALLGNYRFDRYRPSKNGEPQRDVATFLIANGSKKVSAADKTAIAQGEAIGAAVCAARDCINEPAAEMTPRRLAAIAQGLAKQHKSLKTKVLGPAECEKLGMGMFLGVARGSDEEPRFIHMTYTPSKKPRRTIALIGKGVTFDSGGYSLKPSSGMEDMKIDMSGAAAVINAMGAIATNGSPYAVHAVAACCENMVSGRAYRLGDVLRGMEGTTVEINNTDAEGRLTLADALVYTRTRIEPDEIFDFATLTGACMVALGPHTAGVMSNDDALVGRWLDAAANAGEDMWRLPLNPRLKDQLKSNIAEMRNTGERWGGAITAGLFLQHFVKDVPWVHVDLAGPASSSSERGAIARGGVGFAVATICHYLAP
ncbi:MAG TPA: leucyl aminopeptidase [Kofleriaceae bacterium]|nr:leucyl aminopeptidase [Kofleriaceae bacterium]